MFVIFNGSHYLCRYRPAVFILFIRVLFYYSADVFRSCAFEHTHTHTHTRSLTQHDLFAPSRCAFRIHLYVLRTVFGRHGDGRAAASAFFPLFLSASLSLPSRCSLCLSLSLSAALRRFCSMHYYVQNY